MAKAKGEGRCKGRKPTARAKAEEVRASKVAGNPMREIAEDIGISVGCVRGMLKVATPILDPRSLV